ncbi:MAG TPA: DUF222 domain-containing protein [Ornithinibacter sp.]|nr:DUF222 domain-containing protein [Ornithinibacter sp.]
MSSSRLHARIAAMRAEVREVGEQLAAEASQMSAEELFEVTGELQGVLNATEGAQLVATAHAAAHETRLTDRGPVEVHHGLGFVDAMAPSEVSLATGTGQWAAGRRVGLAAALGERFPRMLSALLDGVVGSSAAQKVVSACDGLEAEACAAVEAVLVDRLPDLDPSRVTTVTRRIATRLAADQVRAASHRNRRDRCVQVSPGPDGTTIWWAQIPAEASAVAWSAITTLAGDHEKDDPSLTVDQARADAFIDLLLTNVDVRARVTLGIPVITDTGPEVTTHPIPSPVESATARPSVTTPCPATEPAAPLPEPSATPAAVGCQGLGDAFSISAALTGCELPGIGWIDADTIETLLSSVPLEVGRALLDARTGTLVESVSDAYRPPTAITDFVATRDGTCRMWGCGRPAKACDTDHARPWPGGRTTPTNLGELCRRHHRLKQRRRWVYRLHPDGTVTWTSPRDRTRTTYPDHAALPSPPPERGTTPPREPVDVGPPPF